MNELAVLNKLQITYDLTGYPVIENYELVYDTLASILEGADKLVITADEASVDSAKSLKSQMTKSMKRIDETFEAEIAKLKVLENKKRDLKRLFERVKAYLTEEVDRAKREWVKEAIEEHERIASMELTPEMIEASTYSRKQTKKAVMEAVLTEIEKLEAAFEQAEKDKEQLKRYCEMSKQPFETYVELLQYKTLSDVMVMVDAAVERQKEAEKVVEVATIAPDTPVVSEVESDGDDTQVWTYHLKMTEEQQEEFKQFIAYAGIQVIGTPVAIAEI